MMHAVPLHELLCTPYRTDEQPGEVFLHIWHGIDIQQMIVNVGRLNLEPHSYKSMATMKMQSIALSSRDNLLHRLQ